MIKPPYINYVGQNVIFDIVAHKDQDQVGTCKYLWQSVTARENSPDQVFRGELAMSSRILDIGKMCAAAYQNLLPTAKPPTHPCVSIRPPPTCKLLRDGDSIHQAAHSTHWLHQNTATTNDK